MTIEKDGGPAFPVWELNGQGQQETTGFGMSLRDYFAAKALQGMMASPDYTSDDSMLAKYAYTLADSMMEAREK